VHYVHYITPSLSRIVDPAIRFLFQYIAYITHTSSSYAIPIFPTAV
jgi:hypothetical protein